MGPLPKDSEGSELLGQHGPPAASGSPESCAAGSPGVSGKYVRRKGLRCCSLGLLLVNTQTETVREVGKRGKLEEDVVDRGRVSGGVVWMSGPGGPVSVHGSLLHKSGSNLSLLFDNKALAS